MVVEEVSVEQEEFFRAIVDNSLDAIMVLNSELKMTYASPSTVRILGYKPIELDARGTLKLVHPDDMAKIAHMLTQLAQNPGEIARNVARMRHKNGTWRVIEGVSHNLLHDPRVKGIVITYHDITKRGLEAESRTEHMALAIMKEYHLTEAERKVFILMAKGQSNPEIAEILMVGPSTVRFHVSNILFKLGVTSRTKAMALAMQHYLVI
jgi:PAS domain S-box-containing protein